MIKIFQKVVCIIMVLILVLSLVSCGRTDEGWTTIITDQSAVSTDVTTITFAVPDFCFIDDNNLRLFNEELLKDGYKYQLKLQHIVYDETIDYINDIEREFKNGTSDVAFLGLDDGSNSLIDLFNSGLLLNLDEILSSDKGKTVYESFPKALWEAVKYNGQIYSIPNTTAIDLGVYAAFNKDYIDEEAIENWDGSIEGIYEMIKNVQWDDNVAPRFQYLITNYEFGSMIGCEIRDGLLYDYDAMEIENPLESEKFLGFLNVLEHMKNDGYMADSLSYYLNTSYVVEKENLASGKFLVLLSSGVPDDEFMKDNFSIKRIQPYQRPMIYASVGISRNTGNIDEVMDFLGLLYGDGKYGNILLYGKQDEDYKLIDGLAVNVDGSELQDRYYTELCLDLYINIHPVKGNKYELFTHERKETYFSFYDSVKISPFVGFQPYYKNKSIIAQDIDDFLDTLTYTSLDEAVRRYSEKLKTDGMDDYLSAVKKQWETYHK